ncbi:glycosyltransferase family 9 protein [Nakamurella deserti]|uniref:glycosyltransferase family 9 protein n=1 Tax=Nakamurella deserti TaxID=2164074 RepID=UPI001F0C4318|nr:glycosyltransferase family 9 protein [Nakamurella deserti]
MTQRPVALVLRALGLGDFLAGLPAIRVLRAALPRHEIVLAAPAALAPLVALVPEIDRLFPRGELEPLDGWSGPVDVAVDLHGNGPASRTLLAAVAPRRVVGFAYPGVDMPGPVWRGDEHEVDRWCRLIGAAFGVVAPGGVAGTLGRSTAPVPAGVTVVHPGAASGARRWPPARFTAVARALRSEGHRVVVTGGPAERELVAGIAAAAEVMPLLGLSLGQLAAVVARARLVVCGDTGVAHLASAYRTPSVLLFGPVSPRIWGPPADGPHRVLWHGDGTGDPHGAAPDPALLRITVDEVLDAVGDLMDTTTEQETRCGV